MALFGNDESISIVIKARDEATRIMKIVQKEGDNFKNKIEALQPAFQKMAAVGTAATAAIGFGVVKAIKEATNLGESINAVNVVFGEGAWQIHEFGKNAATNVGLATSAFNQMATLTGALLKDTGKPLQEVAIMTNELTIRAADMASVFNTDVSDAMDAINQAIRGETEAIRRYAGDVTDASLQNFLLSQGIKKSVTEMTEQEKRLYRVQLIMKQTAVTAGDFENTSDSLANRQRILSAQFQNMAATLGTAFIPMAQKLLDTIAPLITKIGEWVEKNPELAKNITIAVVAITAAVAALGFLGMAVGAVMAGWTALVAAASALGSALTIAFAFAPYLLAIGALIAAGVLLYKNWDEIKNFFLGVWENIKTGVANILDGIKNYIINTWNGLSEATRGWILLIGTILTGGLLPLAVWMYNHWEEIKNAVNEAWASIVGFIKAHWEAIVQILLPGLGTLVVQTIKHWDTVRAGIKTVWEDIKNFFRTVWDVIKTIFQMAIDDIMRRLQPLLSAVDAVKKAGGSIGSAIGKGYNSLFNKTVDDAIISPNGSIITTHPDDYLIATKNPKSLIGGGGSVFNFEFNYPQFNNQRDVAAIKAQLDRALRDVVRNHKLDAV